MKQFQSAAGGKNDFSALHLIAAAIKAKVNLMVVEKIVYMYTANSSNVYPTILHSCYTHPSEDPKLGHWTVGRVKLVSCIPRFQQVKAINDEQNRTIARLVGADYEDCAGRIVNNLHLLSATYIVTVTLQQIQSK